MKERLFHIALFFTISYGITLIGYELYHLYPAPEKTIPKYPLVDHDRTYKSFMRGEKDKGIVILDNCVEFEKDRWKPMEKCKVYVERVEF